MLVNLEELNGSTIHAVDGEIGFGKWKESFMEDTGLSGLWSLISALGYP